MDSLTRIYKQSRFPTPSSFEQFNDRLSNLPLEILCHILSFLNVTEVVQTSLLSRKWRYIWTKVPCLNFSLYGFLERCHVLEEDEYSSKFWDVVITLLMKEMAPPVHGLRLYCDHFAVDQLHLLLHLCAMRNVEKLDLFADFSGYSSDSFVESVLALNQNFYSSLKLQASTAFGNLKHLCLSKVLFPKAGITSKLFSDCGFLETLCLDCCRFPSIQVLSISALRLRELVFVNMGIHNDTWLYRSKSLFKGDLKIHAPSLVSFTYIGLVPRFWEFTNTSSLNHALILVENQSYRSIPPSVLGPMVSYLAEAEDLSLSTTFVMFFAPAFGGSHGCFVAFHNLRCLKLELISDADCMEGLINLLKQSPNLETLRIKFDECTESNPWKCRMVDVACMSDHLTEVEITEFHDAVFLLEFIKFFLQNGKSLEKLRITQTGERVNLVNLYALQADALASAKVYVTVRFSDPFGEKEILRFAYRKRRVALWKRIPKWRIRSSINVRHAALLNPVGPIRRIKYPRLIREYLKKHVPNRWKCTLKAGRFYKLQG